MHPCGGRNRGHPVAGQKATRMHLSPSRGQQGVSAVGKGGHKQSQLVAPDVHGWSTVLKP